MSRREMQRGRGHRWFHHLAGKLVINDAGGKLLATQDFADMYAFLKTQHGEGSTPAP